MLQHASGFTFYTFNCGTGDKLIQSHQVHPFLGIQWKRNISSYSFVEQEHYFSVKDKIIVITDRFLIQMARLTSEMMPESKFRITCYRNSESKYQLHILSRDFREYICVTEFSIEYIRNMGVATFIMFYNKQSSKECLHDFFINKRDIYQNIKVPSETFLPYNAQSQVNVYIIEVT